MMQFTVQKVFVEIKFFYGSLSLGIQSMEDTYPQIVFFFYIHKFTDVKSSNLQYWEIRSLISHVLMLRIPLKIAEAKLEAELCKLSDLKINRLRSVFSFAQFYFFVPGIILF